jgi:hypothetical protein
MVAAPADWPVAWPLLLMLATLGAEELQVTALLMVWVLPSLNVPMAVYPKVDAGASTAVDGLTAIEVSVAELTFKGAEPVTPLRVALIFAVPGATAMIVLPLATVATATLSDAQVASRVTTCVLESLNVAVAVNDNLVPGAMVRPEGVTEIETMVAFDTLSVMEALTDPSVALMAVLPGVSALAKPLEAPIFATAGLEEFHVD